MKTKLLLFAMFWIGLISFSQNTYVPDDNFEQILINLGLDSGTPDDYVPTANIEVVNMLIIDNSNIADLTGIEDFSSLSRLDCDGNQLTSLNVSQNGALSILNCSNNLLTNLDVSQNTALNLLYCSINQLTSLDVSNNTSLTDFWCNSNQLVSLNVKNGNNTIMVDFVALTNPNLFCIDVDDATYSSSMWFNIDPHCSFSENCGALGTEDLELESFSMYPNPVNEKLTITLNEESTYSIVNVNGQILKNGKLSSGENTLRTSQLSKGLYFLNIRSDRGFIYKKLIKQ